jgi:hypothetical protein
MWFLALPDILVYFTIFFGGVFAGILTVIVAMLIFCKDGGIIRIQYTSDGNNIKHEDF